MKTINFRKLPIYLSFEDENNNNATIVDIAEHLANTMKYTGNQIMDIGFEELAKNIYYSEGDVEIEDKYIAALIDSLQYTKFNAATKRAIIQQLK